MPKGEKQKKRTFGHGDPRGSPLAGFPEALSRAAQEFEGRAGGEKR